MMRLWSLLIWLRSDMISRLGLWESAGRPCVDCEREDRSVWAAGGCLLLLLALVLVVMGTEYRGESIGLLLARLRVADSPGG